MQFKTLKYQPDFPARFDSIEHARVFCQGFFAWYNHAHRHSGIGYMTPAAVHTGQAPRLYAARQQVLDQAFVAHPERFTRQRAAGLPSEDFRLWRLAQDQIGKKASSGTSTTGSAVAFLTEKVRLKSLLATR